jgi:hypothetical protein
MINSSYDNNNSSSSSQNNNSNTPITFCGVVLPGLLV